MARRNDHSREEIRRMALDAAEAIVAAEGHKGLSARKVARAIGYTAGTLYLVFDSQDDLLLQLNGRTLDALYAWLEQRCAPHADPRENLVALASAYIAFAEREAARWNLLFEFVAAEGGELPTWYEAKVTRMFGLVEQALAPLADHRSAAEIAQAARVLWAGVHGICTLKIRHRMDIAGEQSAEQMARMLMENFLAGFAGRG